MFNNTIYVKSYFVLLLLIISLALVVPTHLCSQQTFNADSMLEKSTINSPSEQVDSLVQSLQSMTDDVQRLEVLFAICNNTVSVDANKCILHGTECMKLAEKLNDEHKLISLTSWLGISYGDRGEHSKAIETVSYTHLTLPTIYSV